MAKRTRLIRRKCVVSRSIFQIVRGCSLFKFDRNENQRDDADRMTLSGTLENSLQ